MDTIRIKKGSTKMVAHRGLSGLESENTIAAFIAAGNRDYFGIEADVHVTADNQFIIIHDNHTSRVSDVDLSVEDSNFETLRKIQLKDINGMKCVDLRMPSLSEYLNICKRYDKKGILELKNKLNKEQIECIVDSVRNEYCIDQMIFISFCYENLVILREILPDAEIQFLCRCEVSEELVQKLKKYNFGLDIEYIYLDDQKVKYLKKNDIIVNCWICDNKDAAEMLANARIDYITTNILQ